ncbi:MAG: cytoplasmic tRNA 2-thiolation protein 2 [Vezdaea aestivalis]|nr:MAG: cytoplasmic tRNA 2-thiolation protein 2 [Vezdaea aestivalis]
MPGKITPIRPSEQPPDISLCRRCHAEEARLDVRNEALGRDCFFKYVHTKAIKRMESYKLRKSTTAANAPKLLLALSGGPSSLALLHILDFYLRAQAEKPTRAPYSLIVMTVETAGFDGAEAGSEFLGKAKARYGSYEYVVRPLSEALDLLPTMVNPEHDACRASPQDETLARWVASLPSATSRQDAVEILKARLVSKTAQDLGCDGVLWGDSTTKLAEKTMAATAKGRAESVPLSLSEGAAPYGVEFRYPMRDVFRKEIVSYTQLSEPPLTNICSLPRHMQVSASSKNTTIEDLMVQYFESIEEGFPSIISNVVRTSSKLEDSKLSVGFPECSFCLFPKLLDNPVIQSQTSQGPNLLSEAASLCYGCQRMLSS